MRHKKFFRKQILINSRPNNNKLIFNLSFNNTLFNNKAKIIQLNIDQSLWRLFIS